VLSALLDAGVDVCGVLMAGDRAGGPPIAQVAPVQNRSSLPIANPFLERSTARVAWERELPVFELRDPAAPEALAQIAELRPGAACVACFPRRIPAPLLALPRLGFLNMHPALLPAHRGPAPLFWTFRAGERSAGVTIHFMDESLDSGDIVAQESFDLPDGVPGSAAERRGDAIGGRLMAAALRSLGDGPIERRPQPPGGSYEPWPTRDDWRIDTSWPARRAFNFMRGTAEWGQPYIVRIGGEEIALAAAIAYDPDAALGTPWLREGQEQTIQIAQGLLRARAA
jgi:methionyl-tRNA formyltransferase